MNKQLTVIAALAAALTFSAWGQSSAAAKPDAPTAKPSTVTVPPSLSTAKLWRLNSKAMGLREQANQTPQAKAAVAAEQEVEAEQQTLTKVCSDAGFVLGYDQDKNSPSFQDLACIKKPADPPPADKKKEK